MTRGRTAFGEHGNGAACCQRRRDALIGTARIRAAAALDEQGADIAHKRAEQGPVADFRFGHEHARPMRMNNKYIEPGKMIGHHHAARRARIAFAMQLDFDAQQRQQLLGPLRDFGVLPRVIELCEAGADDASSAHEMQ